MTTTGIGILILVIMAFIIFWGLGECIREPWDQEWDDKPETPQYVVYIRLMKKACKNTTLFGKIIIGGFISVFIIPSIVIIPIMHFIRDVFKAAMFK